MIGGVQRVWVSRIRMDGAPKHLGSFNFEWQAARKYDEAVRKTFGAGNKVSQ